MLSPFLDCGEIVIFLKPIHPVKVLAQNGVGIVQLFQIIEFICLLVSLFDCAVIANCMIGDAPVRILHELRFHFYKMPVQRLVRVVAYLMHRIGAAPCLAAAKHPLWLGILIQM